MRLEPLYRLRFTYSESWGVPLEGGWRQWLFLAERRAEGSISGRFRGANFPMRRGEAGPFRPDFRAVIETDDGARSCSNGMAMAAPTRWAGARSSARSSKRAREPYSRLNDAVCVSVGEVRKPEDPEGEVELVVDIGELIWEPIAE